MNSSLLAAPNHGTVVLLHGLGLGAWAMKRIEHALRQDGYDVVNFSYPSRSLPLERLAAEWLPARLSESRLDASRPLHFVTHSMGGIVLRVYLEGHTPANPGRVVMLAPPHHGTPVVDHLGRCWIFRACTGLNGLRLGTGPDSLPRQLGPWRSSIQLGVIAGDRPLTPFFSGFLAEPNDGRVPVSSTRIEGMCDHIVLRHSHTWLPYRKDTLNQIRAFLREGRFTAG